MEVRCTLWMAGHAIGLDTLALVRALHQNGWRPRGLPPVLHTISTAEAGRIIARARTEQGAFHALFHRVPKGHIPAPLAHALCALGHPFVWSCGPPGTLGPTDQVYVPDEMHPITIVWDGDNQPQCIAELLHAPDGQAQHARALDIISRWKTEPFLIGDTVHAALAAFRQQA